MIKVSRILSLITLIVVFIFFILNFNVNPHDTTKVHMDGFLKSIVLIIMLALIGSIYYSSDKHPAHPKIWAWVGIAIFALLLSLMIFVFIAALGTSWTD